MRSPREIAFRINQELTNLQLWALPPKPRIPEKAVVSALPEAHAVAAKLKGTSFEANVLTIAEGVMQHKFPCFGGVIETGPNIEWRRDYVNGKVTDVKYLRLIPYLDADRAGDHKNIWELNRHQHLVLLAQAFLFTGDGRFIAEITAQLESWWAQNPFQCGINWTSALEVAFRAFSWIWLYHWVGNELGATRPRLLESLYQHGRHLEVNLSYYFSPNTHLLGEAVVLHALGALFPEMPRARLWQETGASVVAREMSRQVRADGSHFEQSSYYHVYALDMFLFHAVLAKPNVSYWEKLARMADFLHSLLGPQRRLAFIGDDDGGRWFHPYGDRAQFGRATLATCASLLKRADWTYSTEDLWPQAAWWLGITQGEAYGQSRSALFQDSGIVILNHAHDQILCDCGPFGPGRAGHSHSDSLSVVVNANGTPILTDSGTYTYVGDPKWREAFRGTAAHNTIRIDGRDQAIGMGPFWWSEKPDVRLVYSSFGDIEDRIEGQCVFAGFTHRRLLRFIKPDWLLLIDHVTGPSGEHEIEQFWHLGSDQARAQLFTADPALEETVWHSNVFGEKHKATCVVVRRRTTLPASFAMVVCLRPGAQVAIQASARGFTFECQAGTAPLSIPEEWPSA